MTARGTMGGVRRADGSEIERGVHLRWQPAPELGFPPGGFDVYRRDENYGHFLRCGTFREADVVGVAWLPNDPDHIRPGVDLSFPGTVRIVAGCTAGAIDAAAFEGEREVRLSFQQPVRIVRLTFHSDTQGEPTAEGYSASTEGPILVARRRARGRGAILSVTLHADRIDHVVLRGTDMIVCELCFALLDEGRDLFWPQIPLNGNTPIYLPVTHPDWDAPHSHGPDDLAEARSRLPAGLPSDARRAYLTGFGDELHSILYDLVGTAPQRLYRLKNTDQQSAATLDWPGLNLLQLMALDPNLARILGLYWHDEPPSADAFYDYRVVAHYGDAPYPGRRIDFADLELGRRFGPILDHAGVTFVSPNPIEVATTTWGGSQQTGLHFGRDIAAAPLGITLPAGPNSAAPRSVTLHLVAEAAISATAYFGTAPIATQVKPAGQVTLTFEEPTGLDRIHLLTLGDVDLVSIVMRAQIGPLGDLVYDAFHVRSDTAAPESRPALEPPLVVTTATGVDPQGRLMTGQSRVDLRWERGEAGGDYLLVDEPVFYLVQRVDLAADGETLLAKSILNQDAPTLVSKRSHSDAGPAMYSDRSVADGTYGYSVRGIDLFGVLGDWGPSQQVEVWDRRPPPPPQAVEAVYLDPEDPWLGEEDRDWALANGPGVRLRWQWPGLFNLQAPDVAEPLAEFRAYFTSGNLNRLDGTVISVAAGATTSTVTTDIRWTGGADDLVGQSLRINQNFFTVAGHTAGDNCVFTVNNLTLPDLAPGPGPCSLTVSSDHSAWLDYGRTLTWQRRFAVGPVVDVQRVAGHVVAVADFESESADAVIARPGATRTVTLDVGLQDPEGVLLPGALLCDGVVHIAYGHTLGRALQIHLVPTVAPGASSTSIEPPTAARCTYFPGRSYDLRVAGPGLPIADGRASAVAHFAMSCSDGKVEIPDDTIWSRADRGGLGGRPGNESVLSPAARVEAVRRTPPPAVAPPSPPAELIYAAPANYYGTARHTVTWEPVSEASGYAVYRCSGAALFDRDRALRQTREGVYATGSVFADDPDFAEWLIEFDPALTEAEMLADVDGHLDAWRAWAERFYPALSDTEMQALAALPGSEAAFRRVTLNDVVGTAFTDTFDGRGTGLYVYRVRTVDAAGNLSTWPETPAFPPVHIFDVTPPATPSLTSALGDERSIVVTWRANREPDLAEYRLWWGEDPELLADVRRMPANAVASPTGAVYESHAITGLAGGTTLYIRVAAVDGDGNMSAPSDETSGRAIDTRPPAPPAWVAAGRDAQGFAVDLEWESADPDHAVLVQRAPAGGSVWTPVSSWLAQGTSTYTDARVRSSDGYDYRLLARNDSGMISEPSTVQSVPAHSLSGGGR